MTQRKHIHRQHRTRRVIDDCSVCRQLRLEGPDEREFRVTPADGGGWQVWSAALLRFIKSIGDQPSQIVIIEQPLLQERYVQVFIGHGIAYAEASSNMHLSGESRLSTGHEKLLAALGWIDPGCGEVDPDGTPNWSLPLIRGDWPYLVETLLTTIGVFGFSEHLPIEVRCFGGHNPCRDCSWPDESLNQAR